MSKNVILSFCMGSRGALALLCLLQAARCAPAPDFELSAGEPPVQVGLLPVNARIAQGTGQQFSLRTVAASGRVRDRTQAVRWSVYDAHGAAVPSSGPLSELWVGVDPSSASVNPGTTMQLTMRAGFSGLGEAGKRHRQHHGGHLGQRRKPCVGSRSRRAHAGMAAVKKTTVLDALPWLAL